MPSTETAEQLADDPQHLTGVLTHGREVAGDLLAARHPPVGARRTPAVDRDRLLRNAPAETGGLNCLRDARRRPIEHGSQAMPGWRTCWLPAPLAGPDEGTQPDAPSSRSRVSALWLDRRTAAKLGLRQRRELRSELLRRPVGKNVVDGIAWDAKPIGEIIHRRCARHLPVRVDLDGDSDLLSIGGGHHDAEHHAVGYLPRRLAG
jgi:hypothetical protein